MNQSNITIPAAQMVICENSSLKDLISLIQVNQSWRFACYPEYTRRYGIFVRKVQEKLLGFESGSEERPYMTDFASFQSPGKLVVIRHTEEENEDFYSKRFIDLNLNGQDHESLEYLMYDREGRYLLEIYIKFQQDLLNLLISQDMEDFE